MYNEEQLQIEKDSLRERLAKYTRRAFRMLPQMNKPRILDVGCGSGIPTLELARLSKGEIIGIDTDQHSLDRLTRRIEQAGFSDRVKAVNCSMLNMDFPDESFDVIWAEGSTFIIGFESALKEWRRLLKHKRFLVTHEMTWSRPDPPQEVYNYWKGIAASGIRSVPEYLEQVPACGYDVVGFFVLPEDTFWTEYYAPLEQRIQAIRLKYINDPRVLVVLDKEQQAIDLSRKYHQWYSSAFLIMQKK